MYLVTRGTWLETYPSARLPTKMRLPYLGRGGSTDDDLDMAVKTNGDVPSDMGVVAY